VTETGSAGRSATRERTGKPVPATGGRGAGRGRRNPIARVSLYSRESTAELRKAVWPTRTELFTYTTVVVVFLAFVISLVYALDLGFSKLVFEIFG
jgi:preprotein translocase subunit SecE